MVFLLAFVYAGPVEKMYNYEYKYLKENKAMAIAVNQETGAWASGLSEGAPSIQSAKSVAMKFCKQYAKEYDVQRPCKIYAINMKIVGSYED